MENWFYLVIGRFCHKNQQPVVNCQNHFLAAQVLVIISESIDIDITSSFKLTWLCFCQTNNWFGKTWPLSEIERTLGD